MTKVLLPFFGWLYLIIVLDWFTKKIIGYSLSRQTKTKDWLDALDNAYNEQFPEGITSKKQELYLVSDNGSPPTSGGFMQACSLLGIKQTLNLLKALRNGLRTITMTILTHP